MTKQSTANVKTSSSLYGQRSEAARKQFGRHLRRLMIERNLSQSDLARIALEKGDDQRYMVSKWLNGKSLPSTESLGRLAKALDLEPSDLLPFELQASQGSDVIGITFYDLPDHPGMMGVSVNKIIPVKDAEKVLAFFHELDVKPKAKPKRKHA